MTPAAKVVGSVSSVSSRIIMPPLELFQQQRSNNNNTAVLQVVVKEIIILSKDRRRRFWVYHYRRPMSISIALLLHRQERRWCISSSFIVAMIEDSIKRSISSNRVNLQTWSISRISCPGQWIIIIIIIYISWGQPMLMIYSSSSSNSAVVMRG